MHASPPVYHTDFFRICHLPRGNFRNRSRGLFRYWKALALSVILSSPAGLVQQDA